MLKGEGLRLAEEWWVDTIPISKEAVVYGEVGVYNGHNIVSVEKTYATHKNSKMYCIDPWMNYEEQPLMNNHHNEYYENYVSNTSSFKEKVFTIKEKSKKALLNFPNNFFDILYIDGSHIYEDVLEDCRLALLKVKSGGYIICDDTNHPPISRGIDENYLNSDKVKLLKDKGAQRFYQKL